ncbi:MAG: hypothetical protein PGN07_06380 [Aeromicrobium erythreum]
MTLLEIVVWTLIQAAIFLLVWSVFSLALDEVRRVPRTTVSRVLVAYVVLTVPWRYTLEAGVPWWLAAVALVPTVTLGWWIGRRPRSRSTPWTIAAALALYVTPLVGLVIWSP